MFSGAHAAAACFALLTGARCASATGCAGSELVNNGSFESGTAGWLYGVTSGTCGGFDASAGQAFCGTMSGRVYLTGTCGMTHALYQDVPIPAGAASATLTFNFRQGGDYDTFNFARMEIRNTLNTVLATPLSDATCPQATCAGCPSMCSSCCGGCSLWAPVTYNMLPYQGQTVRLWFQQMTNTGTYICAEVYFDCISVCFVAAGSPTITGTPTSCQTATVTLTPTDTILPPICLPFSCTATASRTPSVSRTYSTTATATSTETYTSSGSVTATATDSGTWTVSATPTISGTDTVSASLTPTSSGTRTTSASTTRTPTATPGPSGAGPAVFPNPATTVSGVRFTGLSAGSRVWIYSVAGDQVAGSPLYSDAAGRARWTPPSGARGVFVYLVRPSAGPAHKGTFVLAR